MSARTAGAILIAHSTTRKADLLRRLLLLLAIPALAAIAAACGGSSSAGDDTPAATAVPPSPTPSAPDLTVFLGFAFPIEGACLPQSDLLLPNAPREYRGGTHEGLDFYTVDNCTEIAMGTPVVAAKDGTVVRADHDYTPLTPEELAEANRRIEAGEANAFEVVDLFRGRQVWIDHGDGIITRYAHLDRIADGIAEGQRVAQGQVIAYVGDSGTPESISNPGQEAHLHFEVRVRESFLGAGLPPEDVRAIYERLFAPLEP